MLAKLLNASDFSKKTSFKSEVAEASVNDEKVLVVHPLTYMNASGEAVQAFKSYFKLKNEDILIVHDEMDYPPGKFAFSIGSGPAGHNGVASIQQMLATKEIARLRIGIGRPTTQIAKEDYVLEHFLDYERKLIKPVLQDSCEAMRDWLDQGLTKTMNTWNGVESASR